MVDLDSIHFDVFEHSPEELVEVQLEIFRELGLVKHFKLDEARLEKFLLEVKGKYAPIPYHNFFHVTDVTQMLYLLLTKGGVRHYLTDLEVFALVVAAVAHDMGHSGVNNAFLVASGSTLVEQYGTQSVLEAYSVDILLRILNNAEFDFLQGCPERQKAEFSNLLKLIILATDMKMHDELVKAYKEKVKELGGSFEGADVESRQLLIKMTIKCSDLSNVFRAFPVSERWANHMMEEFLNQGDLETEYNLPVTPMMDRNKASVPQIQVAFLESVVEPMLKIYTAPLGIEDPWVPSLKSNQRKWRDCHNHEEMVSSS